MTEIDDDWDYNYTDAFSTFCLDKLEESLLPAYGTATEKAAAYAQQFFQFLVFVPLSGIACGMSGLSHLAFGKPEDPPLVAFAKNPEWQDLDSTPAFRNYGVATASFQENGPERHPDTNWGQYYHEHPELLNGIENVPDLYGNHDQLIQQLQDMGLKNFRFSLSRDLIEPRPGEFDQNAIDHYKSFCQKLLQAGIEPMVTFDHFTTPLYFDWENPGDIEGFVLFCERMGQELYGVGVRKIVTINEPAVVAVNGWIRADFPPGKSNDYVGAFTVMKHMLTAHKEVYKRLKALHPDFYIGLSHDTIRFRHYHKYNPIFSPIERVTAHYLTEVFHGCFFRALQTGDLTMRLPYFANEHHSFGEPIPLDYVGLQYYSDALLYIGLSGADSVAREDREEQWMTSYQFRTYPQGLASALEECRGFPAVEITEVGCPQCSEGDEERVAYFARIAQVVDRAIEEGIDVRSVHFWTLRQNLEWSKGWDVNFGFTRVEGDEVVWTASAVWLRDVLAR